MQVSLPTSRFSLLQPATSGLLSRRQYPLQSDSDRSRSASPAPPQRPAPPAADGRLQSSGSVRRANPARYRARHPDELDFDRDLDAETTDDNNDDDDDDDSSSRRRATSQRPHRFNRPSDGDEEGQEAEEEDDDIDTEHPSADQTPNATPPAHTQWRTRPERGNRHWDQAMEPSEDEDRYAATERKAASVESKPFQGLSDYALDLGKDRRLIEDDYLKSAFGITRSRRASEEALRREQSDTVHDPMPALPGQELVGSPRSEKSDFFSMEVPLTLDPRPVDLLPMFHGECVPLAISFEPPRLESRPADPHGEPSSNSSSTSTSTLKQARLARQLQGDAATAVAVVSPDQILESPKPRRPFSTVSIEGMTKAPPKKPTPEPPLKSAASNSSDDTSGQEYKSSQHSLGSSMSSVVSPPATTKANHHDSQADHRRLAPIYPSTTPEEPDLANSYRSTKSSSRQTRSAASSRERAAPYAPRRQNSDVSLRTNSSTSPDVNKPLPPEPGRRMNTLSHISEQSDSSRSSMVTVKPEHASAKPRGLDDIGAPVLARKVALQRQDSRVSSVSGLSLRSKYAPKDLEALDRAIAQHEPSGRLQRPYASANPSTGTGTQSLLQDSTLGVIREASPQVSRSRTERGYHKASLSDPQQRNRGPARTETTRRAPEPQAAKPAGRKASLISLYNEGPGRRPSTAHRSQSAQARSPQKSPEDLSLQRLGGSVSKADRILGKSPDTRAPRQLESKWSRRESPEPQSATSSHSRSAHPLSRDEHTSPVEDSRDRHFAEIRERMELLRPREGSANTFSPTQEKETILPQNAVQAVSTRGKRMTPLAELPAMRSPEISKAQLVRVPAVELEGCDPAKQESVPLIREPKPPSGSQAQFVPPPPPPPPLSETPPPVLDRRGRTDGADPSSGLSGYSLSNRLRSSPSQRDLKVRSIASLVASEIPDLYAGLPSTMTSLRPSMTAEEAEQMISAEAAERVLFRILQHLEDFTDLFAAAQVSRGFYRTFKRHELSLLKSALSRKSLPAWELREISIPRLGLMEDGADYMPNLYFSHYVRDMSTITELKRMIYEHCQPFLRPETIRDLLVKSDNQTKIDEAFWRIWTFCKIFGGSNCEHDMVGQIDWLKGGPLARQSERRRKAAVPDETVRKSILANPPAGFAIGNGKGLSVEELYDMTEIWTCLGVLLRGYNELRELAWEFGVFDRVGLVRGDEVRENALIEEWTCYLMTRGPHVVLRAASPGIPSKEHFARVRDEGLTDWKPLSSGMLRSNFLKEALSHAYDEQRREAHPLMATSPTSPRGFSDLPQVVSPNMLPPHFAHAGPSGSHLPAARNMNGEPIYADIPLHDIHGPLTAPMSNFHQVLSRLETIDTDPEKAAAAVVATGKNGPKSKFGRKRGKFSETDEQKAARMNIEAIISPVSTAGGSTPSPSANTFQPGSGVAPRSKGGARLANLKSMVSVRAPRTPTSGRTGKFAAFGVGQSSQVSLPSMPSVDAMSIHTQTETLGSLNSGDPLEESLAPMVDQLVALGFEEHKARKALAKNTKHNFIDFESALASLVKQREIRKKMERLDRMG